MKITPLLRLCAVVSLSILSFSSCSKDKGGTGSSSADINVLDKITDPVFREYIELEMRLGHIKAAIPSVLTTQEAASV